MAQIAYEAKTGGGGQRESKMDAELESRATEYATENAPAWLAGEPLPPEYRALIALMLRDAWLAGATETAGERTR